jgi:hypothetical protein
VHSTTPRFFPGDLLLRHELTSRFGRTLHIDSEHFFCFPQLKNYKAEVAELRQALRKANLEHTRIVKEKEVR